ncbi:MAG: hypothetical protein QXE84_06355 [Candidatus Nitrosotenuis sp.]|uniref:Uncharacterized protein n=1 Tax=Candidatus Nitrosotenuis uzonensis TaxID=1407055 RepID=A0A812EXY4_9ARCH|nr:hypothetical protein [Candidatus Nitrosotenuis uzonensis]MCA2003335.1 hypothetical protein [Candidatus Nitrosotenuis sp.]CAE6498337.1 conserved hypothetical protein [Candidatus Nitrosotenuis uzonensis]
MNKKLILAAVATIFAFGIGISVVQNAYVSEKYSQIFHVDALFDPEKKSVQITFDDTTKKTKRVTLEILGMESSFQRIFESSSFTTYVPFGSAPQYGWRSMPVTFVAEHEELGKIGIKIDIHNVGEPRGSIIFSQLD